MNCPACGASRYIPEGNGCDQCGHYPTAVETKRYNDDLLAKVRENRNRSREAREWAGINMPGREG